MVAKVKPDQSAMWIRIVTPSSLASKEVASILVNLYRAEPTPTASRKNTPLGVAAHQDSKKTRKPVPVSLYAPESAAVRTVSASSHPPLPPKPLAPVWMDSTVIRSLVDPVFRMFVPPPSLVKSHR